MLSYQEFFLDYINNFLTVERFAEYYGLTIKQANNIIIIGRTINNKKQEVLI